MFYPTFLVITWQCIKIASVQKTTSPAVLPHLHVVHHELVGKFAPVLCVNHLLVHEAVDDGDPTVGRESQGYFFVKLQRGKKIMI